MPDHSAMLTAFVRQYGLPDEWHDDERYCKALGVWTHAWRAAQKAMPPPTAITAGQQAVVRVNLRVQDIYQTLSDDGCSDKTYVDLLAWVRLNQEPLLEEQINLEPEETFTINIPLTVQEADDG